MPTIGVQLVLLVMSKKIQRTLTQENLDESRNLRALWDARTNVMSQTEFGEVFEVGSQAAVGQFLNGKAAISLKAAKGFAKGLGCEISAFSDRLAREAAALGEVSGGATQIDLTSLSRDELKLLLLFRSLEAKNQQRLAEFGADLHRSATSAHPAVQKSSTALSEKPSSNSGTSSMSRSPRREKQNA